MISIQLTCHTCSKAVRYLSILMLIHIPDACMLGHNQVIDIIAENCNGVNV